MKSAVTQLYDYKSIQIPEEMLSGRIEDAEIEAQLEVLARDHAKETEADVVQTGDSVACRGDSVCPRWNRERLLFYPGRGLCEEKLENACVGAKTGDMRQVETEDGAVQLTVLQIIRRIAPPVDNLLVQGEAIPGVETVQDYYGYYRSIHEPERRAQAARQAVQMLIKESVEKSEYRIDEEEADEWAGDQANRRFQAMVAAGIDPCIPLQGTDFLTEEQAKEQMHREFREQYPKYLFGTAVLQKEGIDLQAVYEEELAKLAAGSNMSVGTLLEQAGPYRCKDLIYEMKLTEVMAAHVEQMMKED